jgi:outer membrane protein assembly factor BamB
MRYLPYLLLISAAACSERTPDDGDSDAGSSLPDAGTPPADTGPLPDTGPRPDGGPPPEDVVVYAHSRDTLYAFSPMTLTVETIGPFHTAPGGPMAPFMTDLAVDADGRIFTVSDTQLWRVDPETAEVTLIGSLDLGADSIFALTFIVAGELSGTREVLVGATNEGFYHELDTETGTSSMLGRYPDGWQSSGDLVSVSGLGTFATVRRMDVDTDVLIQLDFAGDGTSTATMIGEIRGEGGRAFRELFGLGYWGRVLYAFSNAGELIEINRETGAGTVVSVKTGASQFWGAGVTTLAPVLF